MIKIDRVIDNEKGCERIRQTYVLYNARYSLVNRQTLYGREEGMLPEKNKVKSGMQTRDKPSKIGKLYKSLNMLKMQNGILF